MILNAVPNLVRFGIKFQTFGFLDDELKSIINSAWIDNVMKEVDASKTDTEMPKKLVDVNNFKTTRNLKPKDRLRKNGMLLKLRRTKITKFSKSPLKNNRILVRKLRHHVSDLEKKLKEIENLIGLQAINPGSG